MLALKSAASKENLADIINDMLEELIKNNFEIPAFSTLLRLARATRTIVSSRLYQKVNDQLTDETKHFLISYCYPSRLLISSVVAGNILNRK